MVLNFTVNSIENFPSMTELAMNLLVTESGVIVTHPMIFFLTNLGYQAGLFSQTLSLSGKSNLIVLSLTRMLMNRFGAS